MNEKDCQHEITLKEKLFQNMFFTCENRIICLLYDLVDQAQFYPEH